MNEKCRKLVKFVVETNVEVYSPKDWKFEVKTTIKFKVETTEHSVKKELLVIFFEIFKNRHLKIERRQEKVNVVKERIEKGCVGKNRELWQ